MNEDQNIVDFFDPYNLTHLQAWQYRASIGTWPNQFLPDNLAFDSNWDTKIQEKLGQAWLKSVLG